MSVEMLSSGHELMTIVVGDLGWLCAALLNTEIPEQCSKAELNIRESRDSADQVPLQRLLPRGIRSGAFAI